MQQSVNKTTLDLLKDLVTRLENGEIQVRKGAFDTTYGQSQDSYAMPEYRAQGIHISVDFEVVKKPEC